MATIAGTVFPFEPVSRKGMQSAAMEVFPLEASETFQAGDVVVADGTTRDLTMDNTIATPTGLILGVIQISASTDITANATIDREFAGTSPTADAAGTYHSANIALALPGQLFAGNIIETSIGDETGVYVDNVRVHLPIVEATDGYAAIEANTVGTGPVYTVRYGSPQYDNQATPARWRYGHEAGVGVINPRVEFYFVGLATVFTDDNG